MDPIETWHDAPTFEAMEARIEELKDKLDRLVVAASMACLCRMNYSKRGVMPALEEYQAMMESLTDLSAVLETMKDA